MLPMPDGSCMWAVLRRLAAPALKDSCGRWMMTGSGDVKLFLERLNQARADGRAEVEIDFNRVTHPNSPLPYEALKGRIVYLYVVLVVLIAVAARWGFGAGMTTILEVVGGFSVLYWLIGKRFLERRAIGQILGQLTSDGDAWEKIWRFGGITVRISKDGDEEIWVAPKDSWKSAHDRLMG